MSWLEYYQRKSKYMFSLKEKKKKKKKNQLTNDNQWFIPYSALCKDKLESQLQK